MSDPELFKKFAWWISEVCFHCLNVQNQLHELSHFLLFNARQWFKLQKGKHKWKDLTYFLVLKKGYSNILNILWTNGPLWNLRNPGPPQNSSTLEYPHPAWQQKTDAWARWREKLARQRGGWTCESGSEKVCLHFHGMCVWGQDIGPRWCSMVKLWPLVQQAF
jgi:hypothetical protein